MFQTLKPEYYCLEKQELIRAIFPFNRISFDFKGSLQSCSCNKYLLIVIDEYSRFLFAFTHNNISSSTVILCLTTLFLFVGLPDYVHSGRCTSIIFSEIISFLYRKSISTNSSTLLYIIQLETSSVNVTIKSYRKQFF